MLTNGRFAPFALSLAVVIAVAASFSNPARASVSYEPQPLRVMYLASERIVTARVGKTEPVSVEKPAGDNGRVALVYQKTALLVSTTLKGEHEPVVYVYHSSYGDYGNALTRMEEGQTLLVFLNRRSEGDGFEIDNMRSGLKALSDDELKIYTQRIEELDGIMQSKSPNVAEIVEWLVRCVEEPDTGWEGTYDLWISHNFAANEKQEDTPTPPVPVTTDPETIGEFQAITSTSSPSFGAAIANIEINTDSNNEEQELKAESFYDHEGKFVKALTPALENRLMQVLLGVEMLASKDLLLIEVLQDFDDPRFVPFLLAQMRRIDSMTELQSLMMTVSQNLHDPALKTQVEKFMEEVDSSEDEDEADEVEASAGSSAYQPGEDEDDQQVPDVSTGELKRKARIAYFIALAEGIAPKPNDPLPHSQPTP